MPYSESSPDSASFRGLGRWVKRTPWGQTFISWRLYVRLPVALPGFIPSHAPEKTRRILRTLYSAECASLGHPGVLTRALMTGSWAIITMLACIVNFRRHRPSIRHELPDLRDLTHLRRLLVSAFCNNIAPGEFYLMKFYLDPYYADRRDYLLRWQSTTLLTLTLPTDGSRKIADKYQFWKMLSAADIPTVPVLAMVENGQWIEGNWDGIASRGQDLIMKPTTLSLGSGIEFLDAQPDGQWLLNRKTLTAAIACQIIESQSKGYPLILQPRLDNHPSTVVFGTRGLLTIRIVTMKSPAKSAPFCFAAALRIPAGDSRLAKGAGPIKTPNTGRASSAALVCPIDLATGLTGPGSSAAPAALNLKVHPATQTPLAGFPIPFWNECKELCLRSHLLVPQMNSVGWDIVVTPDGPRMLEANLRWGTRVLQLANRIPLLRTSFVDHYETIGENHVQATEQSFA